ncbi:unnamed protein product [Absidia cylindrospora]
MNDIRTSSSIPRTNKSTSSYISDAAAIKEFYTAVSLVNEQELQNRIHKAMDSIITSWTMRHDDMINTLNELEYSYVTLQHESQAESTRYHKCMRDLQFYKAKCDLITYNNSNTSHYSHKQQQHHSSSLPFDRRSCLSIDSCGRSTIATSVSNSSKTVYSRSTSGKSSHLGHFSMDSFYYPPSSRRPSSVTSTQVPENDSILDDDLSSLQNEKDDNNKSNNNEDTFDMTSVLEHCYPTHIPSAKPPPADDLPLPLPPMSSSSFSSSSFPSSTSSTTSPPPTEIASPLKKTDTESSALVSVPPSPKIETQGHEIPISTPPPPFTFSLVGPHVPSPSLHVAEELKFACGDGFWNTIAKGKSNKLEVELLIKNYLNRGGQPNVANNSGTIKSVKEGYGLIHALLVVRNTNALKRILEAGANPNVLPIVTNAKDMISPVVLAASLGYMNGVRLLVERARVNVLTSKGPYKKNALLAAIEADAYDVVVYLLRACRTLLDQVDDAGATPLHYASMAGKTRMITFLVRECGQIPDAVDYKGETPLHYALRHRRPRAAAKLVDDLGADPNVIKKVATPLDLAKSGGLRPIMAMVRTINNNLK